MSARTPPISMLEQITRATRIVLSDDDETANFIDAIEAGFAGHQGGIPFEITARTGKRGRPATVVNPEIERLNTRALPFDMDEWTTGINWAKVPGALAALDSTKARNKTERQRVLNGLERLTTSTHSGEYLEIIRTHSARTAAERIINHQSGEFSGFSFKRLRTHIASLKTG